MATKGRKRRPRSWVWEYFRKLDKSVIKCNLCEEILTLQYQSSLYELKSHLSRDHNVSAEQNKLMWKDTSVLLWRYFTEDKNLTKATCKCCGTKIITKQEHNLQNHLQKCHSNVIDEICEEIRCTWVSQHFTFDMERCNIKCIHCEWIFKIFVEIDRLKSHLLKYHKINENSGNHEGINDNNRNIMIQQSVAEENYASTSSHHDNRHEQDAGNQTVQQRDNTNMNSSISISFEDDNHDTASAMAALEMVLNDLAYMDNEEITRFVT